MNTENRMVKDVIIDVTIRNLSMLYELLCDCRKNYSELDQLLNPDFHLHDCPYYSNIKPIGIEFIVDN